MTPFEPLLGLPAKGLAEVMQEALAQGESDAGDLCADGRGWLWHGLALATPEPLFRLVGKFGKAFEPDPETGGATLRGWNVRMRQRKDERWEPLTIRDRQVTYGRYRLGTRGRAAHRLRRRREPALGSAGARARLHRHARAGALARAHVRRARAARPARARARAEDDRHAELVRARARGAAAEVNRGRARHPQVAEPAEPARWP